MKTIEQVKDTNKHVGTSCFKCGKSVRNGKGNGTLLLSDGTLKALTINLQKEIMPEGSKIVNLGNDCYIKIFHK